ISILSLVGEEGQGDVQIIERLTALDQNLLPNFLRDEDSDHGPILVRAGSRCGPVKQTACQALPQPNWWIRCRWVRKMSRDLRDAYRGLYDRLSGVIGRRCEMGPCPGSRASHQLLGTTGKSSLVSVVVGFGKHYLV